MTSAKEGGRQRVAGSGGCFQLCLHIPDVLGASGRHRLGGHGGVETVSR